MAVNNICKFNQKGFCKYRYTCRNRHVNEICGEENCREELCELRHPSRCRFFVFNGVCKFGNDCSYLHEDNENTTKIKCLEEKVANTEHKVEELEKVIKDLKDQLESRANENEKIFNHLQ